MEAVDAVRASGAAGPGPVRRLRAPRPRDRTTPDVPDRNRVPDEMWKEPEVSEPRDDTAPDPRHLGRRHGADDPDPTGVRAILAGLPDPGPMPSDLVRRISATLAAEHARAHRDDRGHPLGDTAPRPVTVTALDDVRERRRRGRLPVIAIAASVVVLAGVVIMGMLASTLGVGTRAGTDTAASHSADSGEGDDAAGAAEESDPLAGAEMAPDSGSGPEALLAAGTPLLASGAVLSPATLDDHARTVRDAPASLGSDPAADRARTTGAASTIEGAAACLSGLLSIDPSAALSLVRAVDVVRFDGALVALILAGDAPATTDRAPEASPRPTESEPAQPRAGDEPPTDTAPATTAYLVPLDCARRDAVSLHDPVPLGS